MLKKIQHIVLSLICVSILTTTKAENSAQVSELEDLITDSIEYYLDQSEQIISKDPLKSSVLAKKAFELSAIGNNIELNAYAARMLGESKLCLNDFYEAERYLNICMQYYANKRNKPLIAEIQYLLGLTNYNLRKYQTSLDLLLKSFNNIHPSEDKLRYINTAQNIGLLYNIFNDYGNAIIYYNKAIEVCNENSDNCNLAELQLNLGVTYFRSGDINLASAHYNKAISLYKKNHDLNGIGTCYSNIGLTYLKNKKFNKAYYNFDKANSYFIKTGNEIGQMWALNNMGKALVSTIEYEKAEAHYKKSLKLANKLKIPEGILSNYKDLSEHFEMTGENKKSLEYLRYYTAINDSITKHSSNLKISKLESLYKQASQEKIITSSQLTNNIANTRYYLLLTVLLIILVTSILSITAYIQKRKSEKKLAEHKTHLENLVKKRTQELKEQIIERKSAQESDKLKSAFLANMSHELRTPMNAIIAFSNFLRDPEVKERQRNEYIDHITAASDSLLNIIDDIIDIAKIESQQIKIFIQPTNINLLLTELHKLYSAIKRKQNKEHIEFKLNIDKKYNYIVNTDTNRLKQILTNLLDNAFKYTEKGNVELGFETLDNSVLFYVSDTGIGIPKNKHKAIFERFYQLNQDKEQKITKGTGLGLAICQKLVNLLGGKIWVKSQINEGSTFMIKIPVESLKKQINTNTLKSNDKKGTKKLNHYDWNNITILIAEDEDLNYKVLDTCLTRTNAHIIRARDGASAVEICKNQKVDIVLMDIQMPGMDGYEATQEIKRINNRTPVIAQTSFAMKGEKERCLQAGCDDFITKPLNIDSLLQKIEDHIF